MGFSSGRYLPPAAHPYKGLEVLVAGCGFKLGYNGLSVSLPVLTVGIGRRV